MTSLFVLPTQRGGTGLNAAALTALDAHPELADRLALLDAGVSHLEALQSASWETGQQRRTDIDEARAHRSRIIAQAQELGQLPDPPALARADAAIERAVAARDAASAHTKLATKASAGSRDAVTAAHALLNRLGADIHAVPDVAVPDTSLRDLVAQQRARIESLAAEEMDIAATPMPIDEAIEWARAAVLEAARPIKVIVDARRVDVSLPMVRLPLLSALGDSTPVEVPDAMAILAGLLPDAVADAVEQVVRAKYGHLGHEGISAEDRRVRLAQIAQQRSEAEALEVAACLTLWGRGDYIGLRPDTSPELLLGVA